MGDLQFERRRIFVDGRRIVAQSRKQCLQLPVQHFERSVYVVELFGGRRSVFQQIDDTAALDLLLGDLFPQRRRLFADVGTIAYDRCPLAFELEFLKVELYGIYRTDLSACLHRS